MYTYDPWPRVDASLDAIKAVHMIGATNPRAATVLNRHAQGYTDQETAHVLGVSSPRAYQIRHKALKDVRKAWNSTPIVTKRHRPISWQRIADAARKRQTIAVVGHLDKVHRVWAVKAHLPLSILQRIKAEGVPAWDMGRQGELAMRALERPSDRAAKAVRALERRYTRGVVFDAREAFRKAKGLHHSWWRHTPFYITPFQRLCDSMAGVTECT